MTYEVYEEEIIATRDNFQSLQTAALSGRFTALLGAPVGVFSATGFGNTPARFVVYALTLDGCKTFGTVYLTLINTADVAFAFNSTFGITIRLSTVAPTALNPTPAGSLDRSITFDRAPGVNTNTNYYIYRNSNSILLSAADGGVWEQVTIGYYRSNRKPSWWDEDLYPYVTSCQFNADGASLLSTFNRAVVPMPYTAGQTAVNIFYRGNFPFASTGFVDNIVGTKDILTGIPMVAPQGAGIYGVTDNDFGLCSATGLIFRDQIAVGSQRYTVLTRPTNGTASVVIRTL